MDRGLSEHLARDVARELTEKDVVRAHARDELGIDLDALANPFQVCGLTGWCPVAKQTSGAESGSLQEQSICRVGCPPPVQLSIELPMHAPVNAPAPAHALKAGDPDLLTSAADLLRTTLEPAGVLDVWAVIQHRRSGAAACWRLHQQLAVPHHQRVCGDCGDAYPDWGPWGPPGGCQPPEGCTACADWRLYCHGSHVSYMAWHRAGGGGVGCVSTQ